MSLKPISPAEARALLDGGAQLLDVREPDEHARERIPGAVNAPLFTLPRAKRGEGPVIFHCKSGMRTQANAPLLCACAEDGKAYVIEGGLEGWKAAGLPVTQNAKAPLEMQRQVMIAAGALVLLAALLGLFATPTVGLALAGFVGAGLLTAGVTGFCGMARLLALAPWNRSAA